MEKIKLDERAKQITHKAGYHAYSTMFALGVVSLLIYLLFKPLDDTIVLLLIFVPLITGVFVMNHRLRKDGYLQWHREEVNNKPAIRKRMPYILTLMFVLGGGTWFVKEYFYSDSDPDLLSAIIVALVFAAIGTYSMYRSMFRPLNQERIEE